MKKLILSVLAVMMANSAVSANWVEIGESNSNKFIVYLDMDSIRKASSYNKQISLFAKFDYRVAQRTADNKSYNYVIVHQKIDCEKNQSTIMGAIYYTMNGNSVDSYNFSYEDWQPVYPDSVSEQEFKYACYIAGYQSEL